MTLIGFEERRIDANGTRLFLRMAGVGPPLLLLHGFPETHVAWAKVAPRLAQTFTVIAADLPGYGDSAGPVLSDGHEAFSKREMGRTFVLALTSLGYPRFAVVGHDRGARVAYRMALDHPDRLTALGVLDVIPTLEVADRLTYSTARRMANWFWLAQPSPVPERTIAADPEAFVKYIIRAWGGESVIEPASVEAYVRSLANPQNAHAICDEFRAGDSLDLEHDRQDREEGRRIMCPLVAAWVRDGFAAAFGDPVQIWKAWASDVRGQEISGGHFLMEESPAEVAALLEDHLLDALLDKASSDAGQA